MDAALVNWVRLYASEVVHAETYEVACLVCKLASDLGLTWHDGTSYLELSNWFTNKEETEYDLLHGRLSGTFRRKAVITVVPAEEWLNRHGVFITGQYVSVPNVGERVWLQHSSCAHELDELSYSNRGDYRAVNHITIESPYPAWETQSAEAVEAEVTEGYAATERVMKRLGLI